MPKEKIKAVFGWLLLGFVLYAIFASPDKAADIVRSIWDLIETGGRNVGQFFKSILNG